MTKAADSMLRKVARNKAAEVAGSPASRVIIDSAVAEKRARLIVAEKMAGYVNQRLGIVKD
jgi:hypothetical protein